MYGLACGVTREVTLDDVRQVMEALCTDWRTAPISDAERAMVDDAVEPSQPGRRRAGRAGAERRAGRCRSAML